MCFLRMNGDESENLDKLKIILLASLCNVDIIDLYINVKRDLIFQRSFPNSFVYSFRGRRKGKTSDKW